MRNEGKELKFVESEDDHQRARLEGKRVEGREQRKEYARRLVDVLLA
jgi:hypothetical protein